MAQMMEFTYDGIVRQGFGFYNPNHAAALICVLIPFVIAGFFRWKHPAVRVAFAGGFVALVVALGLTFSRTGVLVLLFELVSFAAFSAGKKRNVLFAAGGVALLILLSVGVLMRFSFDRAVGNRFEIWRAGAALFAANPVFGVGHGNSGTLATGFLLRDGIACRTLVNSHLTLLTEHGMLLAIPYFAALFYALSHGWKKSTAWIAFAGLVFSAGAASVFDWDLLFDFSDFGGLPVMNFLLSWLLLLCYAALAIFLCAGPVGRKPLAVALGLAALCVTLPFAFFLENAPKISGGLATRRGERMPLALYDDAWTIKSVRNFLPDGYRLPLESWQKRAEPPVIPSDTVFLFGECAAFAAGYPDADLIFVSPPPFFQFPPNTRTVYIRRFSETRPETVNVQYY